MVTVFVTDAFGCSGQTSVEVIENPNPVFSIQGDDYFCSGDTATVFVNDIYETYLWSDGTDQSTTNTSVSGSLQLLVTDANGCEGTATYDVAEQPLPVPEIAGELNYCPGEATTLLAEAGFESYEWTGNITGTSFEVTSPGSYELTVENAFGCIGSNIVEVETFVTENPQISGILDFCPEDITTLEVSNNFESYNWSNGSLDAQIVVDEAATYSVIVSDSNGCETTASVQTNIFVTSDPQITGDSEFCSGGNVQLDAGAGFVDYTWSSMENTQTISVSSGNQYMVTVTDGNGCETFSSYSVTENPLPDVNIGGSTSYCIGSFTTLNAGSGFATYLWSDSSTQPTLTVAFPGSYSVTVTDAGGCIGSTTVSVTENPLPLPQITGSLEFCEGNTTLLDAGNGYTSYEWSDNSLGQQLEVDAPGMYSVEVANEFGCVETTGVEVIERALPVFSISGTTYYCEGGSTTLEVDGVFETYEWSDNSTITGIINVNTPGVIGVNVTNEYGCEQYEEIAVEEISLPIAAAGVDQNLDCNVLSTIIGSFGTSTGNEFIYQWTGPGIDASNENLLQPQINTEGTYMLIVTDTVHNCLSEASGINVVDLAYIPDVNLAVDDELDCITEIVEIDASGSHTGVDIIYTWKNGTGNILTSNTDQILEVTQADTYSLEVMDMATGCRNVDSIEVSENIDIPLALAGEPGYLDCNVLTYILDGTGSQAGDNISYSWVALQGAIMSGAQTATPEINQPGLYVLTVLNEENGCSGTDNVVVTQDIVTPFADAGQDQEIDCNSESVTIDASGTSNGGNIVFSWSYEGNPLLQNGLVFDVSEPGVYSLFVENQDNGCSSQSEVVVSIDINAPSGLLAELENPTCFGDNDGEIIIETVVGGAAPYLYSLNGSAFSPFAVYNGLSGGVYTLIVQDVEGCEYEEVLVLEDGNDLQVDLGEDIYINLGEDVEVDAIVNVDQSDLLSIVWQIPDSLDCGDQECLSFTTLPLITTDYSVTVTDVNGCSKSDDITIFVNRPDEVFIPNAFSPNGDGNNDIFMVFGGKDVKIVRSFLIFNRWGEFVFQVYDFPPNDPAYGWDGNEGGRAFNTQVFTYFAEVEFIDGEVVLFKGDVTLMK